MRITCLAENTPAYPSIRAEHGLSLFIELDEARPAADGMNGPDTGNGNEPATDRGNGLCAGGRTGSDVRYIVFDMGQGTLFAENARDLGIDLRSADAALISHGHYDHGGGLETFLKINEKAPVYLSPYVFEKHFNREGKEIGLDPALDPRHVMPADQADPQVSGGTPAGQSKDSRLRFVGDVTPVAEGVTIYSCLDRTRQFPLQADGMTYLDAENSLSGRTSEDFRHEIYLLIEENDRRILISGCSHRGILDIEEWFRPDILIGGFHFMHRETDETLRRDALLLNDRNTEYYTCHCTGMIQYRFMKDLMTRLHYLACGDRLEI